MEAYGIQPNSEEWKKNEKEKESKIKNKEEEEEFVKLFDEVLQQNRGDISDKDIAVGAEEAGKNFNRCMSGSCDRVKLSTAQNLCGFFHRLNPLFAGTTRHRILTAFRHCPELKSCFHRPSLKIVDIGSGAGGDLVGLYSALFDEGFPFQSLQVTGLDYNKKWEIFFKGVIKKLRQGEFGNASKLFTDKEIECSFVCFDVLSPGCKADKKITEADVILMKGFVSILKEDNDRFKATKNIVSAMKPGSLLIIIESPTYEKYFQNHHLSLIFTTRKFLPASPESQESTTDDSTSHRTWENFDHGKKHDTEDKYKFCGTAVKTYYYDLSRSSNQQIFVLVKK